MRTTGPCEICGVSQPLETHKDREGRKYGQLCHRCISNVLLKHPELWGRLVTYLHRIDSK
jgi:hypothetical protein